jgi:hypothetical protein
MLGILIFSSSSKKIILMVEELNPYSVSPGPSLSQKTIPPVSVPQFLAAQATVELQ